MTPEIRDAERGSEASLETSPAEGIASAHLLRRYRSYRARQGRELLTLLPREGLRSIIRAVRDAGECDLDFSSSDGLQLLAERCERLLPLPPFEEWIRDFRRNQAAYGGPEAPPIAPEGVDRGPVTVDVREFLAIDGTSWVAALDLQGAEDRWTGSLRFHSPSEAVVCRTGAILREEDPRAVRDRFLGFDQATLQALLRSTRP